MKNENIRPINKNIIDNIATGLTKILARLLNLFGLIKNFISQLFCTANFKQEPLAQGFTANKINIIPNSILNKDLKFSS